MAMDRNLALELVRATEAAALACAHLMGRGDETAADQAAVDAMRTALNKIEMDGTIVIGEGERDEAPMPALPGEASLHRHAAVRGEARRGAGRSAAVRRAAGDLRE